MKTRITMLALGLLISPMTLAGMDCSDPMHAQMDECKVQSKESKKVGGMDHSKMDHSKMVMPAKKMDNSMMDHSKHAMPMVKPAMKMDHSKMDHSKMVMPAKKMDHSKMDHSKMAMPAGKPSMSSGMDCSDPMHAQMSACKSAKPAIPVSDGSMDKDVPYPFEVHKMEDDPVLTKFMLEQLEVHDADGKNPVTWEAEAWIGKDINKLWLKTEGEHVDGETEELELQALYSRAIHPYWDFQVGLRKDFQPESREWGVLGLKGLAPYYFETDVALFIGESGRSALRIQSEYELMLTQKTVLSPEIELNFHGKDDPEAGVGSGLSDISLSLRLRHEFKREFAPYIGVEWGKKFGNTADFARDEGEDVSDTQLVVGIRAWF